MISHADTYGGEVNTASLTGETDARAGREMSFDFPNIEGGICGCVFTARIPAQLGQLPSDLLSGQSSERIARQAVLELSGGVCAGGVGTGSGSPLGV